MKKMTITEFATHCIQNHEDYPVTGKISLESARNIIDNISASSGLPEMTPEDLMHEWNRLITDPDVMGDSDLDNCDIITVYALYGQLAHEKRPIYTDIKPTGSDANLANAVKVAIPLRFPLSKNAAGETLIDIDGSTYLFSEVLTNRGDAPYLAWVDRSGGRHSKKLTVI